MIGRFLLLFALLVLFTPHIVLAEDLGSLLSFNTCPDSGNARFFAIFFLFVGFGIWLLGEMLNASMIALCGAFVCLFMSTVFVGCSLLLGVLVAVSSLLLVVRVLFTPVGGI